jgi:hypothetical protein
VKQATQTDKKLLTSKEWHKRKYILHHDRHEYDGRVRQFYQQQCKLCMRGENLSASRHARFKIGSKHWFLEKAEFVYNDANFLL